PSSSATASNRAPTPPWRSVPPSSRCTRRMTAPGSRMRPKRRAWWRPCARTETWSSRAPRRAARRPPTAIRSRASARPSTAPRRSANRRGRGGRPSRGGPDRSIPSMLTAGRRRHQARADMAASLHSDTAPVPPKPAAGALVLEKTPLERYVAPDKPSLVGLSRTALGEALAAVGVPPAQQKMRVQQLFHWIYLRGAQSFDQMTSVSKELRAALDRRFTLARPEIAAEQRSVDGTRKWLLRLASEHPGERPHEVECVYIPETDRGTLCLSSQVG